MIDRQGNRILIECDSCDEVFEGDEDDEFAQVWNQAKRDGWRTKKIGSDWVHGCPKCKV
jgi:hypothetical protein